MKTLKAEGRVTVVDFAGPLPSLAQVEELIAGARAFRLEADELLRSLREARGEVALRNARLNCLAIQRLVAAFFDKEVVIMTAKTRTSAAAWPRMVAMYFCRRFTKLTLMDIGAAFGNRDHTTVLNAVARVQDEMQLTPAVRLEVERLDARLRDLGGDLTADESGGAPAVALWGGKDSCLGKS